MQTYDLVLKDFTALLPDPNRPGELIQEVVSVGIKGGRIEKVGSIAPSQSEKEIQGKGLHLLPGLIDSQVHFRDPGHPQKEDFGAGTRGAILGGITAVFDMPNTKPSTLTAIDLEDKKTRAHSSSWCNYAFYMGAAPENTERLHELEVLPGVCGIKIFMGSSTGSLLIDGDELLEAALKSGKRRVAVHCEDESRLKERKALAEVEGATPILHPVWRDEESAFLATRRLLKIARKYNRPVHVLHVTTLEEMQFLADQKDIASVEVTPQHLTLSAPECYERLGSFAQMNPPIRNKKHQDALWEGIKNRTVDIIGSDHAPHTKEEKARPYPGSPSGMTGVQTMVPLMLNHFNAGKLSLERVTELLCLNPCRLFGIKNKGAIKEGFDADFTICDLKKEETISNQKIASKCGWSPFDGMKVQGFPTATIISGQVVMRDGEVIGSPSGKNLSF